MPATPSISLDHDPISINRTMISSLFEHDLSENRVCAFPGSCSGTLDALALRQGYRDEARRPAALDAHQNAVLVVGARGIDRLAHVAGTGNVLAGDFENHVAFLEATLCRRTLRIDLRNDDAVLAGAGNAVGRCHRQAELRHVGSARGCAALIALAGVGLGFHRIRQLTEREVDDLVLALVKHVELHRIAGRKAADGAGEFPGILDRLAIHRRDHIARFNAGLGRRSVGLRFRNQSTLRLLEAEAVGDVGGDRLDLDADPATADGALVLELGNDILHGCCRDRERDADAAAGRRIDRGVDAHDLAFGVEGRATGVALVHGRVDLDEIVVRAAADVAAAGRDNAGGHRAAKAERIADREHPIADPGLTFRKLGEREVRTAVDLDQGDIGPRVGADHLRGIGLALVSRNFDLVGAIHHVVVGHGIAIGRDEETGTLTGHHAAATAAGSTAQARRQAIRSAEAAEEALHRRARLERRILLAVRAIVLGELLGDIDLHRDHRRLYALDDVGKADRLLYLADFVVDLRVSRAAEDIDRTMRRAEAVDGDTQASDNRRHQRELARRQQRTAGLPVGWERRKIDGAFVHYKILRA